jgi:hypothetical protein
MTHLYAHQTQDQCVIWLTAHGAVKIGRLGQKLVRANRQEQSAAAHLRTFVYGKHSRCIRQVTMNCALSISTSVLPHMQPNMTGAVAQFASAALPLTLINCNHCYVFFNPARRSADFTSTWKLNRVRRPVCGWCEVQA